MKTIIFYRSSYRGNTLKIAESMKDALSAELVSIDSNPSIDLSDYDLIGFGSAINFAAHDIRLQRFVSSQNLKGKKMCSYFPPVADLFWGHIIAPSKNHREERWNYSRRVFLSRI